MRQTNSTLTFLNAQYRAIFKEAYVKGLASSAILGTAFLSTVNVGDAQAVELERLEQLKEQNANLTMSTSGSAVHKFEVNGKQAWDANVTVTASDVDLPHAMTASWKSDGSQSSLKGSGSLTVDSSESDWRKRALVAFGENKGTYEFEIDLSKVDVKHGEIRIKSGLGKGRNTRLNAQEINVDGGESNNYAVIQIAGQAGNKDAGSAYLGSANANINLGKGSKSQIRFSGYNPENAVMEGNLNAQGGVLEFKNGDGTVKTRGQATGTNITIAAGKPNGWHENRGRTAVFDFDKTLAKLEDTSAHLAMDQGTIDIEGFDKNQAEGSDKDSGVTKKAATLQVRSGTLELGANMKVKSAKNNSGRILVGANDNSIQAKMRLQKEQLMAFLEGDKDSNTVAADNKAGKGRVELTAGGTLDLKRSAQDPELNLNNIEFTNTIKDSDGKVFVRPTEGASVATDKLVMDQALKGQGAQYLTIKADHITFKEQDEANQSYNFKRALASEVSFESKGTDGEFNLRNEVQIAKTTTVDNPYNPSSAPIAIAAPTSIEGNITVESGGKLQIAAGEVTTTGKIKVTEGSISLGGAHNEGAPGVDATWKVAGSLELTNTNKSTIDLWANGTVAIPTEQENAPHTYQSHSKLDLTEGQLKVTGNKSNFTTIHARQSTIALNQENFNELLNADGRRSGDHSQGAAVVLDNNATLDIQGDLQAAPDQALAANKIKQVNSAAEVNSDEIGLINNKQATIIANKVHLSGNELNLGANHTLQARNSMVLDAPGITQALAQAKQALASAEKTLEKAQQESNFKVKTGTVIVNEHLSATNKAQGITFGNDGTSAASLNLGHAQLVKDSFKRPNTQGQLANLSSAQGTVDVALKLEGIDASKQAQLNVVHGKWQAQDIDASKHAHITVGSDIEGLAAEQINYNPESAPELKANKVTLAEGSNITISTPSKAHFERFDMQGGEVALKGQMVVGQSTPNTAKTLDPVFKSTGGSIAVTGAHAQLELKNNALQGLKLQYGKDQAQVPATTIDPDNLYANNVSLSEQARLKLDFKKDQLLTLDDINALRQEFMAQGQLDDNNNIKDGYLDVGEAQIANLEITDHKVDWAQLKPLTSIQGGLSDVLTQELKQATLINVPQDDVVTANVGNIQFNHGEQVKLGNTTLHHAAGTNNNFITSAADPNKALGAVVTTGANVGLYNGGNIGEISLESGKSADDATTLMVAGNSSHTTHIAHIKGENTGEYTKVSFNAPTTVEQDITNIDELQINSQVAVKKGTTKVKYLTGTKEQGPASLSTPNLEVIGDQAIDFAGDLNVQHKAHFAPETTLRGNNQFGELSFAGRAHLAQGTTTAKQVSLQADQELLVGSESAAHGKSSQATLIAQHLDLNVGTLVADPDYQEPAAIVAVGRLGNNQTQPITKGSDEAQHLAQALAQAAAARQQAPVSIAEQLALSDHAGELKGKVVALQNSIVALGVDTQDQAQTVAELNNTFAPFMKNGALQDPKKNEQGLGAIALVNKQLQVAPGGQIIVDAHKSYDDYQNSSREYDQGDIYLGANSALAISQEASTKPQSAAITFNKKDAKVYAQQDAQILITGENFNPNAPLKLFADSDGAVDLQNASSDNLAVKTVNGLFELKDGLASGPISDELYLSLNPQKAHGLYKDVSRPVKETILAYADKENSQNLPHRQVLHGAVAPDVSYDAAKKQFTNSAGQVLNKADYVALKNAQGNYEVYQAANNKLLNNTITIAQGKDVEQVARLTDLGGSTKSAFEVASKSAQALAEHLDMGNFSSGDKEPALTTQQGSVWARPMYSKGKSQDLEAQGLDYGHDSTLYGMTAGIDFNVKPNIKVGALVTVGQGKVEGRQAASGVTNDVTFVGGGIYSAVQHNNAQVLGDISYHQVRSDLETNTSLGTASAKHDTRVISAGVKAQYDMDVNGLQVSPHAGVRYSHINTQDHDIKLKGQNVASYQGENMDVVSIPVGVKLSKNIKANTWNIKPALDLSVTGNMGNLDHKGAVKWQGIDNLSTPINSAVLDKVTMGANANIQFTKNNFSAGAQVNYTTSQNADDLSVGAQVEFKF